MVIYRSSELISHYQSNIILLHQAQATADLIRVRLLL